MNRFVLFFFSLILGYNFSFAHPHVFIDNKVEPHFDKNGLAGFHISWTFDEMFGGGVIFDFDKNRNRKLEKKEQLEIKQKAFSNLKNFNYFTQVLIDNREFKVKYVTDFKAKIEEDFLVYSFFIPCHLKARKNFTELRLTFSDLTNYTAISTGKSDVNSRDCGEFKCEYQFLVDKPYYNYNQKIIMRFKLR